MLPRESHDHTHPDVLFVQFDLELHMERLDWLKPVKSTGSLGIPALQRLNHQPEPSSQAQLPDT